MEHPYFGRGGARERGRAIAKGMTMYLNLVLNVPTRQQDEGRDVGSGLACRMTLCWHLASARESEMHVLVNSHQCARVALAS